MSQTDECISNLKINSCPSCYTTDNINARGKLYL